MSLSAKAAHLAQYREYLSDIQFCVLSTQFGQSALTTRYNVTTAYSVKETKLHSNTSNQKHELMMMAFDAPQKYCVTNDRKT